jgi:hypothetical protein
MPACLLAFNCTCCCHACLSACHQVHILLSCCMLPIAPAVNLYPMITSCWSPEISQKRVEIITGLCLPAYSVHAGLCHNIRCGWTAADTPVPTRFLYIAPPGAPMFDADSQRGQYEGSLESRTASTGCLFPPPPCGERKLPCVSGPVLPLRGVGGRDQNHWNRSRVVPTVKLTFPLSGMIQLQPTAATTEGGKG